MRQLLAKIVFVTICIAIGAPIHAPGQVETGELTGTVTDPSGALIPGALVNLKNSGTNAVRSAVTSSDGAFRFAALEPATYEASVHATGFQPYTVKVQIT